MFNKQKCSTSGEISQIHQVLAFVFFSDFVPATSQKL